MYTRSLEAWDLEDAPARAQSPNVQHGLDFEPVALQVQAWDEIAPERAIAVAQVRIFGAEEGVYQHDKS